MSRIRNAIKQDKMFVNNAIVKVPRSTFNMNQKHSTTFNAGRLVPIHIREVIPGDTFEMSVESVIRTTSPFIKAPMDELHVDQYAFFVPHRIVYSPFTKMIANYHEDPDWTLDTDITVPFLHYPDSGNQEDYIDTIADHMGLPPMPGSQALHDSFTLNAIPFRGYVKIWNEWFRDENLQKTIYFDKDSFTTSQLMGKNLDYQLSALNGGQMCPVNKIKDYFTTCLPAPQAGAAASLNLGGAARVGFVDPNDSTVFHSVVGNAGTGNHGEADDAWFLGFNAPSNSSVFLGTGSFFTQAGGTGATDVRAHPEDELFFGPNQYSDSTAHPIVADLSQASGISVNDLRYLIQIQQIKELDARYGRRYKEYLMGHWGVLSSDARLDIPEFLGHVGYDLNINQTVQTSGTLLSDSNATATTPQSNISSYSLTAGSGNICNKSFTEHGYVFILACVRVKHRTYTQGVNRMWFRRSRFDFYDPCFANIGEQPVYNAEIYLDRDGGEVFGYQEAWADYRYTPNICSGYQRPQVPETLAYWNFADNYTSQPTLSGEWVQEDISSIDRCLAIPSDIVPQFTADFYIKNKATRPMPLHSIPGLVDHSGKIII